MIFGEVSADFGGADVAHDRKRRVIQVVAIPIELAIRFIERFVLALALVFPGEGAAFPDIDESRFAFFPSKSSG